MNQSHLPNRRGAALIIVLAFLVILSGLVVAYLSRTSTDRQLAHGTFNETRSDVLARSALDLVVSDLKQEIVAGSSATPAPPVLPIYLPTPVANMIPRRSGVPLGAPDPLPNLIKRSVSPDNIASPGVPSRASTVNSTKDISSNGRSITLARWNKHYLLPRYNTGNTIDSTPSSPLLAPFNPNPPVATGFTPPDWVLVTRAGPTIESGIGSGASALNNPDPANSNLVIGRYAYSIYDEGGLLDANVVGFPHATPSPTVTPAAAQTIYAPSPAYAPGTYPAGYTAATYTAQQLGRKGSPALADLSSLPAAATTFFPATQINNLVGWRNYVTAQPGGDFSAGFTFNQTAATSYFNLARSNTAHFLTINTTPSPTPSRTDQAFLNRQELLSLRSSFGFSQNLLQYLGTFSREYNRSSWKPQTPSAVNPDLSGIRVTTGFTRVDTSPAIVGEPLLKNRFTLRRLSWLTYAGPSATRPIPPASPVLPNTDPNYDMWQLLYAYGIPQSYLLQGTAANIKASFGLVWDSRLYVASPRAGQQWVYASPSSANSGGTFDGTSGTGATIIKALSTVQTEAREPDFFELLKAVILNGSVGLGSNNAANTFVVADPKYYDTINGKSADYQLMQIGANIIDEWDTDNFPTYINFNSNEGVGIENLPYLSKLLYLPNYATGSGDYFDSWLVPSLWNPHQNAAGIGTIRVALNGTGNYWGYGQDKSGAVVTQTKAGPISPLPATMDISAAGFSSSSPQSTTPIVSTSSVTQVSDASFNYWGFHYPFLATTPNATAVNKTNADSDWPDFGTVVGASSVELQIPIPGTTTFVPYQTWVIAATGAPLISTSTKNNFGSGNKLQDPEFVSIDPRTTRFGVWGTDAASQTGGNGKKDYTAGAADSMDEKNPANRLEQISLYQPQGANFTVGSLATLSTLSANSGSTTFYKDLDGVQRVADITTGSATTAGSTIMAALNTADRPRFSNGPFQSVAELGQVFRDQPWKTLAFTISNSADAGLLDAFTLQDVSSDGIAPTNPFVWTTAGRPSLNTRQASVLAAVISQAALRIDGSSIITKTQTTNVAQAIVALTTANPLMSKGDLVALIAADSTFTGLGNKEARECVMRALTDAGQTRTWNLMIDVIAQSGRYPPTAAFLKDFVVEGEKRYWLHIAIDRFTGEVIDQQLEAVFE